MWPIFTAVAGAGIILYVIVRALHNVPVLGDEERAIAFARWLLPPFEKRRRPAPEELPPDLDPILTPRKYPLWLVNIGPLIGAVLLLIIARHSSRHPDVLLWKIVTVIAGILLLAAFLLPPALRWLHEWREQRKEPPLF